MAKENNILGVDQFGFGTPGDGVMGTIDDFYNDVEVGSVNIEGSSPNDTTIPTEEDDAYITISDTANPSIVTARLYGVTPEQMVNLAGGSVNAEAGGPNEGMWEAPTSQPNIYKSFEMLGKAINGKQGVLRFPYAKIIARLQGTATKNGLPAVEVTITANTPESSGGVKGHPVIYGTKAV